ncbi:4-hydroxybenzoate polyprenyltransferase-like prenyltransferase [Desulfosporosinus orientis DSM 765]|uniref:4-hydroxybenzoate polyprenyltransferase-like prenyltransferase n=1 Tax=Desulfosporosinus orientis (strain ATCC 19365 / DSM 765 / NCIMB 8382 / VKM B-1628 / Singapore I) TaxID=768706 RepID=G7WF58_DESOD|nr:UbiA family prenyltransferase [Desulfosporosinus orientis]AET67669.1 4-hydroxybenzoate polyprenyltransferase-like prenyltransferase [Desulfosporosinus orientis DSM 765]
MFIFIKAYIKSMRLYYAFVTGIAGWIGMAFYEYIAESPYQSIEQVPDTEKKTVILILLFLSWGINQIVNDYLGLAEDKINAPNRPMVTGELDPQKALLLTGVLLMTTLGITYFFLEPIALIPAILGVALNIVYEYAKGCGIAGNLVFGLMISTCTAFGFMAAGPTEPPYFTYSRVSVLILVTVMNGLMTFYTYFKDYEGDKAAGKKTLIVRFGVERSRYLAAISAFLPAGIFGLLYFNHFIEAKVNTMFLILAGLTVFLELWTGYLYFKNPQGERTYFSLVANFRACICGQASLIALFNSELAMLLFLVSYMFVGFIFDLHADPKS